MRKAYINSISRKRLVKRGKKDATICTNSKNYAVHDINAFFLQFINEEIAKCLSRIHIEKSKNYKHSLKFIEKENDYKYEKTKFERKQDYNKIKVDDKVKTWKYFEGFNYQQNMNNFSNKQSNESEESIPNINDVDQKKGNKIGEISQTEDSTAPKIIINNADEAMARIQHDICCKAESKQHRSDSYLTKKINKKNRFIEFYDKKKENSNKALKEKCTSYYAITIARISAYWSGVLTVLNIDIDIIEFIDKNNLLEKVKAEIKKIES